VEEGGKEEALICYGLGPKIGTAPVGGAAGGE
jgi:hypothetical protein